MKKSRKALFAVVMAGIMLLPSSLPMAHEEVVFHHNKVADVAVNENVELRNPVILENTIKVNEELFESFNKFVVEQRFAKVCDKLYIDADILGVQFEALRTLDSMGVRNVSAWLDELGSNIEGPCSSIPNANYMIRFNFETGKMFRYYVTEDGNMIYVGQVRYRLDAETRALRQALVAPHTMLKRKQCGYAAIFIIYTTCA
jgi:hypothetical protein